MDGSTVPDTIVLDWSPTDTFSAEAIAFFPVVSRHFVNKGCTVFACDPHHAGLAKVLAESGVREESCVAGWIPVATTGQITVRNVAPAAVFGPERTPSVELFIEGLSTFLRSYGVDRRKSSAVVGATSEFLHNVLSHGEARNAAAAALMFVRRRPRILQVGIADDGIGIPTSLVSQPRHQWLMEFSDALATRAAMRAPLSGRQEEAPGALTGGGMARIVKRLLSELQARVIMRSGAAFVSLSTAGSSADIRRLTYGHGTQTRLEFPLP